MNRMEFRHPVIPVHPVQFFESLGEPPIGECTRFQERESEGFGGITSPVDSNVHSPHAGARSWSGKFPGGIRPIVGFLRFRAGRPSVGCSQ